MREIKFRCWGKESGRMFSPSSISFKGSTVWVCDVHGSNIYEYELVVGNTEVMQYTGLLDKNGKEIYEGDIIKLESGSFRTIVFHEGCFWFTEDVDMEKEANRHPAFMNLGPYEIIGNIYENPELLRS